MSETKTSQDQTAGNHTAGSHTTGDQATGNHDGHYGFGQGFAQGFSPWSKFDPTKMWMAGFDAWSRVARESMERMQAFYNDKAWQAPSGFDGRFDPLSMWSAGVDAWSQVSRENLERMQALIAEMSELEHDTYERAKTSGKDFTAAMSESLDCWTDLAREWRKLGLEAARRGISAFETKA